MPADAARPCRLHVTPFASRFFGIAALSASLMASLLYGSAVFASITIQDINPDNGDSTVVQNLNATSGGRVNRLAVAPGSNTVAYAASEWGGLYKTIDGGSNWTHLDDHVPQATWSVAVDPSTASTVYATSFYDGRVNPRSGIEVSRDAGATWTHPPTAIPPIAFPCDAASKRSEPSAFEIGIQPDDPKNVFVGTNCGLAISADSGVSWTFVNPNPALGATAKNVWGVVAQAGGIVDVCGQDGHFRSIDGGTTWNTSAANPLGVAGNGRCTIAASPLESGVLLAMSAGALWEGDDDGTGVIQWTQLQANIGARLDFVVTNQTGNHTFDVYIGAGVSLFRINCDDSTGPPRCPAGPYANDVGTTAHADPGHLVFDLTQGVPLCPLFYSSDGGIYRNLTTAAPGCLNPTWDRRMDGLHATWLWDMSGAQLPGSKTGIYYGLQDDGFWGSPDAPGSWANPECCDVFTAATDVSQVVYSVCCVVTQAPATRLYSRAANNPGGARTAIFDNTNLPPSGYLMEFQPLKSLDTFGANSYVFVTQTTPNFAPPNGADAPNGPGGVFITTNNFGAFTQLGAATTPAGACGVRAAVAAGTPTFYLLAGNCGGFGGSLWAYTGTGGGGTWTQIDNGMLVGIYAVDPTNPNRLYVSDVGPAVPRMMFSTDGGTTWNPDVNLDLMMTQNGAFKYRTIIGPTDFTGFAGYTQPTLVAFDPQDPKILVAGGRDSGVFISRDGGQSWALLTDPVNPAGSGKPHLPRPWFAFFDHKAGGEVDIVVGTQGRGVWRFALVIECPEDTKSILTRAVDPEGNDEDRIAKLPTHLTLQDAVNKAASGEVIGFFGRSKENVVIGGTKSLTITQCTVAEITGQNAAPVADITTAGKVKVVGLDTVGGTIGWRVGTSGHTLSGVRATGASQYGILVVGSNNTISFNSLRNNGVGIRIEGNTNSARGGVVELSNGDGVQIAGNSNTFRGSTVQNNSGNGILVSGSINTIRDNSRVDVNTLNGVLVTGNTNIILSNEAGSDASKGNTLDGFKVNGNGNLLNSNKASASSGNGFSLSGGTQAAPNRLKSNQSNQSGPGGKKENGGAEYLLLNWVKNDGGGNKADGIGVPKNTAPTKCPSNVNPPQFPATNTTFNYTVATACE